MGALLTTACYFARFRKVKAELRIGSRFGSQNSRGISVPEKRFRLSCPSPAISPFILSRRVGNACGSSALVFEHLTKL